MLTGGGCSALLFGSGGRGNPGVDNGKMQWRLARPSAVLGASVSEFRVPLAPDEFPVLGLAVVGRACRCRRLAALVS